MEEVRIGVFKPRHIFLMGMLAALGLMAVWQRHEALQLGYEIARLEAERMELREKLALVEARIAALESPSVVASRVAAMRLALRPPDPARAVFPASLDDASTAGGGRTLDGSDRVERRATDRTGRTEGRPAATPSETESRPGGTVASAVAGGL